MIQILLVGLISICLLLYNFRGPGQTFIQFLRAKNMFIASVENNYQPIPRYIEAPTLQALPSGFMLLYCIQTLGAG